MQNSADRPINYQSLNLYCLWWLPVYFTNHGQPSLLVVFVAAKANYPASSSYEKVPIVGSISRCTTFNALKPLKWALGTKTTCFSLSPINESYMSVSYSPKNSIGLQSRTTMCSISPWVSTPSSVKSSQALNNPLEPRVSDKPSFTSVKWSTYPIVSSAM